MFCRIRPTAAQLSGNEISDEVQVNFILEVYLLRTVWDIHAMNRNFPGRAPKILESLVAPTKRPTAFMFEFFSWLAVAAAFALLYVLLWRISVGLLHS